MKPRLKAVRQESGLPYEASAEEAEAITLAEQAYRSLRRDLITGEFAAGQSLRLESLKQRYGISYSPIREALNRLQSERMVTSSASRGFRVAPFSREEMWDAAEARILIDCQAMRLSLQHADDAWETRLVAAFHALTLAVRRAREATALHTPAHDALEQRHWEFHRALLSACGSPWLMELSSQMYVQTERYRRPTLRARSSWHDLDRDVGHEHQAMMDAALARDADRATWLLAEHYRQTVAQVEKLTIFQNPAPALSGTS